MRSGLAACLFLLLAFALASPASAQSSGARKVVLVGNFVNETGDPKWDGVGIGIANSIAVKLGNVKSITVTNEEARRRVMAEQRFGQSGFVNEQTAAETGRLVGATHIAYGTYTLAGDQLMAYAYLVNCATAMQEGACEAYSKTDATAALINELSLGLVGKLGATATEAEIVKVEREDTGKTIDTLTLMGKAGTIMYDEKGAMRRNLSESELMQAKNIYEQILAVEPENTGALNSLGNVWGSNDGLGDDDKAITYFRKVLVIDSDYAVVHNNLGIALKAKGDLDGAIAEYRKALAIDPDYAVAHNNLGIAFYDKGNIDGAIAEYRKALAIDPDIAEAHNNLGLALAMKGDLDGAIAEYRKALAIDPDIAVRHYNLGIALADKRDLDGAIIEYRKALAIDPDIAAAWFNLGLALRAAGRNSEASDAFRNYIECSPGDPDGDHAQVEQWIAELEE